MLAVLGDLHGDADLLQRATYIARDYGASALLQVGDFGLLSFHLDLAIPVYWILGNHERWGLFNEFPKVPEQVGPDCWLLPNGYSCTLDGRRLGFMGGADSVDQAYNASWSPKEIPTPKAWASLLAARSVDYLITHTPGQRVIDATTQRTGLRQFGLSVDWVSPVAVMHDYVRAELGNPPVFCGHMHYSAEAHGTTILDIGQLRFF